jgi:phage terminase large subunit-like protein
MFHEAGKDFRERLLMAGNQLGKTLSAAAETSIHATGRYPDWWKGRVFTTPIDCWVSGVTGESTRDNPQRWLYGPLGQKGTGMLPLNSIKDASPRRGLADALDTLIVKWGGGGDVQAGESQIGFKSYDQGREKWQGPTKHFIWFDEEPPQDIYTEGLTRTNVNLNPVFTTFTPLQGMSDVVKRFLIDKVQGTHVTQMEIEEAEHYSPEERKAIIASYPPHEREARAKGIPMMGSGRVFPVEEEFIKEEAFEIPSHWAYIGGIDFGWDHPSAGVKIAWDRDSDVLHVIACHRKKEQTPVMFAATVKPWGNWLPWSWPHDGEQSAGKFGGKDNIHLAQLYQEQGLKMLPEHATFEDGGNGVEAGVQDMLDRMMTGRLKVFSHLNDWFEEFRLYHRKDGLIVKLNDDILCATRYAIMMKRFATVKMKKPKPVLEHRGLGWQA